MAKNPAAVALGKLGGKARRESLSPEERSEIARQGGKARFGRMSKHERREYIRMLVEARLAKRKAAKDEQ